MKCVPDSRFLILIPNTTLTHSPTLGSETRDQEPPSHLITILLLSDINILFVNEYERRSLIRTVFPAFKSLKQNTLSLAATTEYRGCYEGTKSKTKFI